MAAGISHEGWLFLVNQGTESMAGTDGGNIFKDLALEHNSHHSIPKRVPQTQNQIEIVSL